MPTIMGGIGYHEIEPTIKQKEEKTCYICGSPDIGCVVAVPEGGFNDEGSFEISDHLAFRSLCEEHKRIVGWFVEKLRQTNVKESM